MRKKKTWIVGLAAMSFILVLFVFNKFFASPIVLSAINTYLGENFGTSVSAAASDFNIFSLGFSMEQPVFYAMGKKPGRAFLKAEKVEIRVTLDLLLGRKIHFRQIHLDKPYILVQILKDGSDNLPIIKPSAEMAAIPEFIFDRLTMSEMRVFWSDETNKMTLLSPILNVELIAKGDGDHQLSVDHSGPGELSIHGRNKKISKLHLDGRISHQRLAIAQAGMQIEKSELDISGVLSNWLAMQLDMQVKGNVSAGDFSDLLPPGSANRELGRLGRIRFGWQLVQDREFLKLNEIDISALHGEILGHAVISRLAEKTPHHLLLNWKGLDLSLLKGVLPADIFSYASGNMDVSFLTFARTALEGSLSAQFKPKAMRAHEPDGVALAGDLRLGFARGAILVKKAHLHSRGNSIQGEFNIDQDTLSGFIHGQINHLRGILLSLSPFNDTVRSLAEMKIDGEMRIAAALSGTMAKPVLQVRLTQGKIRNLTRSPLEFAGSLLLQNRVLQIGDMRISQSGGMVVVNGALSAGAAGQGMDLRLQSSGLDLAHWGRELPFALPPMQGILDFDVRLTKKPDVPFLFNTLADGEFSLSDFNFAQMQLGNVRGKINSTREKINFLLHIPSSNSELSGAMDLRQPFGTKIEISTRDGSLKEVARLLPMPIRDRLSGTVSGRAQVAFLPMQFRESLSISCEMSDLHMISGNRELRNKNPLHLAYRSGALAMEDVSFMMEQVEVHVSGELTSEARPGKEITVSAKGTGDFLSIFLPDLLLEGDLDAKIVIKGSMAAPVYSGSVRVEQGRLLTYSQALPLTNMHVQLELKDNLLILHSLRFNIRDGEVSGRGTVPMSWLKLPIGNLPHSQAMGTGNVDLTLSQCPLAGIAAFLVGSFPANTTGAVSGSIHFQGENPDLSDLVGSATLSLADLSINGLHFSLKEPIKIISKEQRIILQEVALFGQEDLQLTAKGFVGLQKEKPLEFSLKGKLDSRVVTGFLPELAASGRMAFALHVGGTMKDVEWNGRIEVMDNSLQFEAINLFANQLNGAVSINNGKFVLEGWNGNLNGGTVELHGSVALEKQQQPEVDLRLQMADVKFNFPQGLFTDISGELQLRTSRPDYLLRGNIDLNGGNYNEAFHVGSYLYEVLFARKEILIEGEKAGIQERLRLDIQLRTLRAIVVDNNVSRAELSAGLTVGGTVSRPLLTGRIHVTEGGSIFFGNRIFAIEKGQIDFVNPNAIEPDFNIDSRTQVGAYDVRLALSGPPQAFVARFSSVPSLSEQAIASMLATGKAPDDLSGSVFYETGNVALNYLGYAVSGKLQELIKKNLDLHSFRIDGSLLSSKEDPGAKITIGKNIAPNLELAYSQGLRQTQDRTWVVNYKPLKSLNFQGTKSSMDLYTLGVQYRLSFHSAKGAAVPADTQVRKPGPLLIEKIQIEGDAVLARSVIMKRIQQKAGRVFSFAKLQEDSERLRGLFRKEDYLSARISANYYPGEGGVTLVYRIAPGKKVFLNFLGAGTPQSLREECRRQWLMGQFDMQRVSNVNRELTRFFIGKKHFQVKVSSRRVEKGQRLFVYFFIAQGRKYGRLEYDLTGNRQVTKKEIVRELKKQRLEALFFSDPGEVRKKLEGFYRDRGFAKATISMPQISFRDHEETAVIRFHIDENALFRISKVSFAGSAVIPEDELVELSKLKKGLPISELQAQDPVARIEEFYREKGFNQVNITLKSVLAVEQGLADIEFTVSEGVQSVISEIKITGNKETRGSTILRELTFQAGDRVNFYEINQSRKNLYDLGIFDLVDFELTEAAAVPAKPAVPDGSAAGGQKKYFQVRIKVKESPVYHLRGGGQYDTDSQLAVRLEGENSNLFGLAHSIGAGFQWSRKEIDVRGYYRLPYLFFNKGNTIVTAFANQKEESSFRNDRQGFTVQQQVFLGKLDPGLLTESADVAHVTLGYFHDQRDNIFNPARGISVSGSIQHAARFMGSDYPFTRYSGQLDFYLRAAPRLTWATSLGVGLVDGRGQTLSLAEKFFASGRGTLRGFAANEVGPVDAATGQAIGGEAVLIFRQELRWQIVPLISVVGFSDWGNIFARGGDFAILKLRKSAGIGVRFHLQPLLLRLDWGMKLDRRPDEKFSSFYFGIGHIF